MTKDEAMKLALDALENHTAIKHPQQMHYRDTAIEALRQALEQPEQEPVNHIPDTTKMMGLTPSEWVSLTDQKIDELDEKNWGEDRKSWGIHEFARAIEAKLKEKNT
jgi:hypothetical protein